MGETSSNLDYHIIVLRPIVPITKAQLPVQHSPGQILLDTVIVVMVVGPENSRPHQIGTCIAGHLWESVRILRRSTSPPRPVSEKLGVAFRIVLEQDVAQISIAQ
jgi:hypothetical protein